MQVFIEVNWVVIACVIVFVLQLNARRQEYISLQKQMKEIKEEMDAIRKSIREVDSELYSGLREHVQSINYLYSTLLPEETKEWHDSFKRN